MDREMITAESLLRDIYEAESALRWFEQKYGIIQWEGMWYAPQAFAEAVPLSNTRALK